MIPDFNLLKPKSCSYNIQGSITMHLVFEKKKYINIGNLVFVVGLKIHTYDRVEMNSELLITHATIPE